MAKIVDGANGTKVVKGKDGKIQDNLGSGKARAGLGDAPERVATGASRMGHARPVSAGEVLAEAARRNGGPLSQTQMRAAQVIAGWYDAGVLSRSRPGHQIRFVPDYSPTVSGGTVGLVEIGSAGFRYLYEVSDGQVTFRQGDGVMISSGKLPWNYRMRSKLDGAAVAANNRKWAIQSFMDGHGI